MASYLKVASATCVLRKLQWFSALFKRTMLYTLTGSILIFFVFLLANGQNMIPSDYVLLFLLSLVINVMIFSIIHIILAGAISLLNPTTPKQSYTRQVNIFTFLRSLFNWRHIFLIGINTPRQPRIPDNEIKYYVPMNFDEYGEIDEVALQHNIAAGLRRNFENGIDSDSGSHHGAAAVGYGSDDSDY